MPATKRGDGGAATKARPPRREISALMPAELTEKARKTLVAKWESSTKVDSRLDARTPSGKVTQGLIKQHMIDHKQPPPDSFYEERGWERADVAKKADPWKHLPKYDALRGMLLAQVLFIFGLAGFCNGAVSWSSFQVDPSSPYRNLSSFSLLLLPPSSPYRILLLPPSCSPYIEN